MRQMKRRKPLRSSRLPTHLGFETLEEKQLLTVVPTTVSVTPSNATTQIDTPISLAGHYADADGVADLMFADLQVFTGTDPDPRCFVRYDANADELSLWNDATASFITVGAPGSANSQSNGSCTLDAASSSVATVDATTLEVSFNFSFDAAFDNETHLIWMRAYDDSGQVSSVDVQGDITFVPPPPAATPVSTVTMYFDDRDAAMALNYDTELYMCGMIHSNFGYDPAVAAARATDTRIGWPNVIADAETYDIPLTFNICGHEAVFGDEGPAVEYPELDTFNTWHPSEHWDTNTWYSDAPPNGGNYLTVGDLSGTTQSYGLVYGGDLTELALNSDVDFEIAFHSFGHESLSSSTEAELQNVFARGVEYHKRIGVKPTAEGPPWLQNPQSSKYNVFGDNGFFAFNRWEGSTGNGVPYEVVPDLWVIPRGSMFNASTDLTDDIDDVIANGHVLAPGSHQEDGFENSNRAVFQNNLAYAKSKVDSGELWATTLSEVARYAEAKSVANVSTEFVGGKTVVDISLSNYDRTKFGIPYLTFRSPMPNGESHAKITVNGIVTQTLNSAATRIEGTDVVYSIYLNPDATTVVEIEGVTTPFSGGVDINAPELSIDSVAPVDPVEQTTVTIDADAISTDAIYSVNLIYQVNNDAKASLEMTPSGGSWTSSIGPFDDGDTVTYYVSVTDESGTRERSVDRTFNVIEDTPPPPTDTEPPQYSDATWTPEVFGQSTRFGLHWTDNVGLAGYTFSFDDGSGTFVDDPYVSFAGGENSGAISWWDNDWSYRQDITVDNTGNPSALTDHAVLAVIDTASLIAAGKMNPNGGDIRLIDGTTELNFWVESGLNTANTRIWVNVPNVPGASSKQISLYYGNTNRTVPRSDGAKTFPLFDNFGGTGWEQFKYENNPIKGPGHPAGEGAFSSVLLDDDGIWKMYSSYDEDNLDIALSTSTDGLNFTRVGIVLEKGSSGEWDSANHWAPVVWKEDAIYHMLRPARGPLGIMMGYATSIDGVNWTKYNDPTTTSAPFAESDPVFSDTSPWVVGDDEDANANTEGACFSAVKHDGTYYVVYGTLLGPTVSANGREASIVTSTDLINWTLVDDEPRFPGGDATTDWNYNNFCGHAFEFEDEFYLLMPGQDSSRDYAKFGLYVSGSPDFPENDTEFKGIIMTGANTGWDSIDMDTPWIVYGPNNVVHMYYEACGDCHTETGVVVLDDFGTALAQAYAPGNYVDLDRDITGSQRIMPPVGWTKSTGSAYTESLGRNFEVTLDTSMTGRAINFQDANPGSPLWMGQDFDQMSEGTVSAWMRVDSDGYGTGDYEFYVYGDSGQKLALVAGLGGNGEFHYWDGAFQDTGITYSADTWYRVELEFDVATNKYDFVVFDTSFTELVRVNNIDFGNTVSQGMDRVRVRSSSAFNGDAYVDDVSVRAGDTNVPTTVGVEVVPSAPGVTDAWAYTTKPTPLRVGATTTYRWKYTAIDVNGNETVSAIEEYKFQFTPLSFAVPAPPLPGVANSESAVDTDEDESVSGVALAQLDSESVIDMLATDADIQSAMVSSNDTDLSNAEPTTTSPASDASSSEDSSLVHTLRTSSRRLRR